MYQPYPTNYYQPMNTMYQPQMQMQTHRQVISGRLVDDFSSITANDVPMDGSFAVFPKRDMSEIEMRAWSSNGLITSVKFRPVIDEPMKNTSPTITSQNGADFEATMDDLKSRLDRIEILLTPTNNTKVEKGQKNANRATDDSNDDR